MRSALALVLCLLVLAAQGRPTVAQEQCPAGTPDEWIIQEKMCAAFFSARARRLGQRAPAQMMRANAEFLIQMAERHMREIGADAGGLQTAIDAIDESILQRDTRGQRRCETILKADKALTSATLTELVLSARRKCSLRMTQQP